MYKIEYLVIFEFLIVSIFIALVLYFVSYYLSSSEIYMDKNMAYECGFNPFEDARQPFDVRFYLVGLLFIIFDLEIIFLFPWCLIFYKNILMFWIMFIFIILLFIGFIYEWAKKAIEWT